MLIYFENSDEIQFLYICLGFWTVEYGGQQGPTTLQLPDEP